VTLLAGGAAAAAACCCCCCLAAFLAPLAAFLADAFLGEGAAADDEEAAAVVERAVWRLQGGYMGQGVSSSSVSNMLQVDNTFAGMVTCRMQHSPCHSHIASPN
jgi:hypothetical protein